MGETVDSEQREQQPSTRWRRRPLASFAVSLLAFFVPVCTVLGWTLILHATVAADREVASQVQWWLTFFGGLLAVVWISARVSRRLLPVSALLRLDLDFPAEAPSRLSLGLRAGSRRWLDRVVSSETPDSERPDSEVHERAETLLCVCMADREHRRHAERVRRFTSMIGGELFLTADDRMRLEWVSLLHDVEIHGETIEGLSDWLGEWSDATTQTAERFDGTGQPDGLAGEEITLGARIVSVAESYDWMTSAELRRDVLPPDVARTDIEENAGTAFDPDVVRAFLAVPSAEMDRPIGLRFRSQRQASIVRHLSLPTLGGAVAVIAAIVLGVGLSKSGEPESLAFHDESIDNTTTAGGSVDNNTGLDVVHLGGHPVVNVRPSIVHVEPAEAQPVDQPLVIPRTYADVFADLPPKLGPAAPKLPVAIDDSVTTLEDTEITVAVLANDGPDGVDLDLGSLQVLSTSSGQVTVTGGRISYAPPADAVGTALIVYQICSVEGDCDTATLQIDVTPVEDLLPFAADGELLIPSDAGPQVIPWIVVSSGSTPVNAGTTITTATDRQELFNAIPAVDSVGTLTFEPRPGAQGAARATITVDEPGLGRRTFVIRLVVQ